MASEAYLAFRAVAADPHLWIGGAALFIGVAAGQALRALLPGRVRNARTSRIRSRRIARAIAYLSLALLLATCLLIFPAKEALDPAVLVVEAVVPYAAILGAAGALAGAFPLAAGLPALALGPREDASTMPRGLGPRLRPGALTLTGTGARALSVMTGLSLALSMAR